MENNNFMNLVKSISKILIEEPNIQINDIIKKYGMKMKKRTLRQSLEIIII